VSGGSPRARGRSIATVARTIRGTATALTTAHGAGSGRTPAAAVLAPSGARVVTWLTVQQHAERTDGTGAGACFLSCAGPAGQQHAERITPSYAHRYQDAVAIDGARANVSRIAMMRCTWLRYYTPVVVPLDPAGTRRT
jgi:hypothetical protein